jgi:hypothetical protein
MAPPLVRRDGAISWMCVPRLTLTSGADLTEDVSVARHELLRYVTVLGGTARIQVDVAPRGAPRAEPAAGGLRIICPERLELDLHVAATVPLEQLRSTVVLRAGEAASFLLRWSHASGRHRPRTPAQVLEETIAAWRRWMTHFRYEGPQQSAVRRSAIALQLLDHFESGSIVAVPTSSLPEAIGGVRNWDYRYAWIRDAAFSVYALHRIGFSQEAAGFLGWVLDAVRATAGRACSTTSMDAPRTRTDGSSARGLSAFVAALGQRRGRAAATRRLRRDRGLRVPVGGTPWRDRRRLVEPTRTADRCRSP